MLFQQIVDIVEELKECLDDKVASSFLFEKLEMLVGEERKLVIHDRERFSSEEHRRQEELEQNRRKLQSILDNVYEGIVTISPHGIIDSFNLAAERIFGYEASEVIGKNVKILMPEPYYSEHDGYLENYMHGGKAKVIGIGREVEGQRKDGSTFPLYLAVTKVQKNGTPLFIGMVRDISEQKRLEQMKNDFVSTVSHELRTPLTSIRGSLSLIDSGVMGEVGTKIAPLVKIALNNSERLIILINDILDMEKIESGKMNFDLQQVDINTMIMQAVEANEGYAKQHNVTLTFQENDAPIFVYVDINRMQQVLSNLISNAVKYSPSSGTVALRLIEHKRSIRVEVQDNGPGIPMEFKKRIFQKFAQADSSDTKQKGGTGLGLNITKSIIEKFGGTIGFLSPEGSGATFFFNLPVLSNVNEVEMEMKQGRGKVLIVEDDHDIAMLLKIMLQQEEIECDIAYNASEAKTWLKQTKYDAMTLDIMLPGQDGLSLLEEIRKDEMLKDLPVVVVSAKAKMVKNQESNMALEVLNWINKPIDRDELITSFEKIMVLHELSRPIILHVEDDPDIASLVKTLLDETGEIHLAVNKRQMMEMLKARAYDLILLDMILPDGSAEELLPDIKKSYPAIPIVLFSAQEVNQNLKGQVSKALVKSRVQIKICTKADTDSLSKLNSAFPLVLNHSSSSSYINLLL